MMTSTTEPGFSPVSPVDVDDVNGATRNGSAPAVVTPVATVTSLPGSFPSSSPSSPRTRPSYKHGFSTSICDLFNDPYDRSNFCALACCGVLLHDRNHYILNGARSPWEIMLLMCLALFPVFWVFGLLIALLYLLGICILFFQVQQIRTRNRNKIVDELLSEPGSNDSSLAVPTSDLLPRRRVHRCCVCVPIDIKLVPVDNNQPGDRFGVTHTQESLERKADVCTCVWQKLAACCCAASCGCWWNACGMCAAGQEDRELRLRLPRDKFWIDFVTMQPYAEYYPAIQALRAVGNVSFLAHLRALSKLSQNILKSLPIGAAVFVVVAFFTSNLNIDSVIALLAVFGQAVLILYVVYWNRHRLDVSLDAVIKFFASGLALGATFAFVTEIPLVMLGEFVYAMVIGVESFPEVAEAQLDPDDPTFGIRMIKLMAKKHPLTFILYFAFISFCTAAFVEETTKYFCFWMVEHPDMLELEANNPHEMDVLTASSSDEEATASATDETSQQARRGYRAKAASITCGLVASAAGFACCENLMYVFGLGESSLGDELSLLLVRSVLPVHPICGALQSIGIVRRDIENDAQFKFGRALLPAILLHGSFDFALMTISFFRMVHKLDPDQDFDDEAPKELNFDPYALGVGAVIVFLGVLYYKVESKRQRDRLAAMEISGLL